MSLDDLPLQNAESSSVAAMTKYVQSFHRRARSFVFPVHRETAPVPGQQIERSEPFLRPPIDVIDDPVGEPR